VSEGEVEVRGGQRNDAAEQDGTEGVNAAGGEEVAVDLPEVPDGGCGGDEGADGGRGRGHATERPPAPRKDSAAHCLLLTVSPANVAAAPSIGLWIDQVVCSSMPLLLLSSPRRRRPPRTRAADRERAWRRAGLGWDERIAGQRA